MSLYEDMAELIRLGAPFHYFTKPSPTERQAGCDGIEPEQQDETRDPDAPGANNPRNRGGQERGNNHPTVKPIGLMRWIVRLVTPAGGKVLDVFGGSGTTAVACQLEGYTFTLMEMEPRYVDITFARVAYWSALRTTPLPR